MLEIRVKVFEKSTKEGKKFNVYKAVQKNGSLLDVKFRKEVSPLPTTESIIVINDYDGNIDENRVYPCLWVKAIQEIKPLKQEDKVDPKLKEMF